MTSALFTPLSLRTATFKNRIFVSPMCQYSTAGDGVPLEWHFVHLGQFAVGGAALVMTEATAVSPEGRLSPQDTGLWNAEQTAAWAPIVSFVHENGARAGIQLGHAGRKGSTSPPWDGEHAVPATEGGWQTIGPSPLAFDGLPAPREMTRDDITRVVEHFAAATQRAAEAGFDVVELHAAHGYLVHEFLSPLSNIRTDEYGGSLDGRAKFLLEVVDAMRAAWPEERPLFVRLSATDWVDEGWGLEDTIAVSHLLRDRGVDLVDCSSGGTVADAVIPVGPGYQVPFARAVRSGAGIATGAVGRITDAAQADQIIAEGSADAVLLGKELLRNPHWPLLASVELGESVPWPDQYATSRPRPTRPSGQPAAPGTS